MILIISNKFDQSTINVINWLDNLNAKYFLINDINDVNIQINLNNLSKSTISNSGEDLIFNEVKSFWYRRSPEIPNIPYKNESWKLNLFNQKETDLLINLIHDYFVKSSHVKTLNSEYDFTDVRKPMILIEARKHGLKIPNTIITNNIIAVKKEYSGLNRIVFKPISNVIRFRDNSGNKRNMLTNILNADHIASRFIPCLFQNKIDCKVDIRVVYFLGEMLTVSIKSNENNEFNVDYRNYSSDSDLLISTHTLPHDVKLKLNQLLTHLKFKFCSVDFMLDKEGNYIFLEINPIGQYSSVLKKVNLDLDYKIAHFLFSGKRKKSFTNTNNELPSINQSICIDSAHHTSKKNIVKVKTVFCRKYKSNKYSVYSFYKTISPL